MNNAEKIQALKQAEKLVVETNGRKGVAKFNALIIALSNAK